MSAIAAYRTAILALLDDPSKTRYTEAQCDQALRMALQEYSIDRPLINTYELATDGNQRLALPADFNASYIENVELDNVSPNLITEVPFYAFKRDEQWFVETTGCYYEAGFTLIISYSTPHYIDGLDGAAGTSIPAEDEAVLQAGAAGFAAFMRATSRAETINMQPQVSAQLSKLADTFLNQFRHAIASRSGAVFADPPASQDISFLMDGES